LDVFSGASRSMSELKKRAAGDAVEVLEHGLQFDGGDERGHELHDRPEGC
jgi:hypothetical protein